MSFGEMESEMGLRACRPVIHLFFILVAFCKEYYTTPTQTMRQMHQMLSATCQRPKTKPETTMERLCIKNYQQELT